MRQTDHKGQTWHSLLKLNKDCQKSIEDEITCDLVKGPDHEDCRALFIRNEDCFQKSLCYDMSSFHFYFWVNFDFRWADALTCLRTKSREACEHLVTRSRACKAQYFDSVITPRLEIYLRSLGLNS